MRRLPLGLAPWLLLLLAAACGSDGDLAAPANDVVRERLEALAPAANLAHRGTGPTRRTRRRP